MTAAAQAVLERWAGGAAAAAAAGREEVVARWARDVVARYEEPQRHYHTGAHVAHLLALAEEQDRAGILNDPANVTAAILFHDVVYDPTRHDNEALSADLLVAAADELGVDSGRTERARALVLATTRHALPDDIDRWDARDRADLEIFLDDDLEVLAWAPDAYARYAAQIRREYAHVADDDYRRGRTAVLKRFLERPYLYFSLSMRARCEAAARANVTAEIAELAAGPLP